MASGNWTRQTPDEIDALFARQRGSDPFGTRLHLWAGVAACFLAGFPTTYVTWAALPVLAVWLVRMWTHHRVLGPLWWEATARLALAWSAWLLASLAWSDDRATGLDEAGALAFLLLIPALYPLLDRRDLLLRALCAGLLLGVGVQALHVVDTFAGQGWFRWGRLPGRYSGWWDPVVGGSLLCGLVGIAGGLLSAAIMRRGRLAGLGLLVAGIAGTIATGSRGAWIACTLTMGASTLLCALVWMRRGDARARTEGDRRRFGWRGWTAAVGALAVLLTIAASVVLATPSLRARFEEGQNEVRAAVQSRDYSTFTGARVAMWEWAWAAWKSHPVAGVGAGGYRAWVRAQTERAVAEAGSGRAPGPGDELSAPGPVVFGTDGNAREIVHAHAHGLVPQVAATTGAVGVVLVLGLMLWPLIRETRDLTRRHAATAGVAPGFDTSAWACAMGLLGLAFAGLFDSITVNQQTWYLTSVLLALGVGHRPSLSTAPVPAGARKPALGRGTIAETGSAH